MTPITRQPGVHVTGSDRAGVLAWLRDEREFALVADATVMQAGEHCGWYAYTPDGCCWAVALPDGTWRAGDSADREMRLADDRRTPVQTRIDPATFTAGDTLTWWHRGGLPELLTGQVVSAGELTVTVTRGGRQYLIDMTRVTGHRPSRERVAAFLTRRYGGAIEVTGDMIDAVIDGLYAEGRTLP